MYWNKKIGKEMLYLYMSAGTEYGPIDIFPAFRLQYSWSVPAYPAISHSYPAGLRVSWFGVYGKIEINREFKINWRRVANALCWQCNGENTSCKYKLNIRSTETP